ncbi:hypothetical protein [Sabulicella glaciei]|uniref:Uncharacterized protein n=1 Tax=Sabulicella glaciei TaxID=2984948 RepID=A0ABT3P2N4_9PROT|nr:hypothetical protein [Roseococcus sp. MDT2-1-1]MCW8088448.1 hypothetical protein [Roseococcus sp. MDT2-1-1]
MRKQRIRRVFIALGVLAIAVLAPGEGAAQFGDCAAIANPAERLQLHD